MDDEEEVDREDFSAHNNLQETAFSTLRREREKNNRQSSTKKRLEEIRKFSSGASTPNSPSRPSSPSANSHNTAKAKVSTQKPSLLGNSRLSELESLFQEERRRKVSQQTSAAAGTVHRRRSYRIARALAAPVEGILRFSPELSSSSTSHLVSSPRIPNFYRLFDLKSPFSSPIFFLWEKYRCKRPYSQRLRIDENELKKKYRQLALAVHPDKNPHPDAKIAFDFLQDAYETLSQESAKNEYDQELWKQYSQRYHWNRKKVARWWSDLSMNVRSQLLLIRYQWKSGETIEVFQDIGRSLRERVEALRELIVHFALLPSALDRFFFVNELLWMQKLSITISFITYYLIFSTK